MAGDPAPLDLTGPRRVHVVGVGGAGMSAIASVLAAMGHAVSGSDLKASPVTARLATQGVTVHIGHRAANLGPVDVVTYSPAVPADNPELVAAVDRGIPVVPRSAVLGAMAATRRCLAVAGTHGKTTTASMLALVLVEAGLHPSFVIGADVSEVGTNAVWDTGELLVVEADESYGSFSALVPEIAVLTNVEPDHLDFYGTVEALEDAFSDFWPGPPGPGSSGPTTRWPRPSAAGTGPPPSGLSVGSTYTMRRLGLARSSVTFELAGPDGVLGPLAVPVPGLHNARNAAVAVVAGLAAGAPFAAAAAALGRFAGVPRRFEFRGEVHGVTFVDDYAHLPAEVRAALAAARTGDWARVVAVFQPHRYSRTAALAPSFADAFDDADVVIVTDVFGAGERPVPGVSGRLVADAVAAHLPGRPVLYAPAATSCAGSWPTSWPRATCAARWGRAT